MGGALRVAQVRGAVAEGEELGHRERKHAQVLRLDAPAVRGVMHEGVGVSSCTLAETKKLGLGSSVQVSQPLVGRVLGNHRLRD